MSFDAKTTIFKKDKNNNLTAKECDIFVKNYKDFTKGVIIKIVLFSYRFCHQYLDSV